MERSYGKNPFYETYFVLGRDDMISNNIDYTKYNRVLMI